MPEIGTVGTNLKTWRAMRGLTQRELGELIGIDGEGSQKTVIWQWETGRRVPNTESLSRLAQALNCSLTELLKEPGQRIKQGRHTAHGNDQEERSIGDNIRTRREALGLSQSELGKLLGTTGKRSGQSMIAAWEVGKGRPKPQSLVRLATALQCTIEDLVTDPVLASRQ